MLRPLERWSGITLSLFFHHAMHMLLGAYSIVVKIDIKNIKLVNRQNTKNCTADEFPDKF